MEYFEEKAYLCALNRIFGFEPKIAHAMLAHFGSAAEVFNMNANERDLLLGPYSKYRRSLTLLEVEKTAVELDRLSRSGTIFIGCTENGYPKILLECEDAPVGLYVRSRTPPEKLFSPRKEIGIVGTRDLSPYGREWCTNIVKTLSETEARPRIISGLALGTDICAHKSALDYGLETIAVMATGPDSIYPTRHREFALRLCEAPGCALITDYPPGTAPLAIHFLRRNRIIAGLSEALLLIESKIKGGGMMTSRLAFSYSRDVFALPGRVDDIRSQGCNFLIKSKIAEPIISPEDLAENLGLGSVRRRAEEGWKEGLIREYGNRMTTDRISQMTAILLAIRKERGIQLEELCSRCGLDYSQVAMLAGILETDGFISIDLMQRCTIVSRK